MARDSQEVVVYSVLRDSQCSQCQQELPGRSLLTMHEGQSLCLHCADMEHLTFLPAGNTALTRRARMHSKLWAVAVRFSRARKRYERQGLLVEEEALTLAQEKCLADENLRQGRRIQAAEHRKEEDRTLAETMRSKILEMFPACPRADAETIARHTSVRGSGRVGRSKSGRNLEEEALRLAVIAHIRHRHTRYDDLLLQGEDRAQSRRAVRDEIRNIMEQWMGKSAIIQ